jgi:putative tryptophan/tyrosine transport system substrate-binding protein
VTVRRLGHILALALGTLLVPLASGGAQTPENIPRIGYLVLSPLVDPPTAERQAFLDGLRELGYVVGRTIIVEYRSAAWNRELLPDLAAELVDRKVGVIVATPGTIEAARQATQSIPIVFTGGADPVASGLVASLARPGGNITGMTFALPEMAGKRVALLKEAFPKISRLAVLWSPDNEGGAQDWQETKAAALALDIALQSLEVRDPKDFPAALSAMTRRRPHALITFASSLTSAYRPIIVEFAKKQRLLTMFGLRADVEAGGLMSYAPSAAEGFRRAAYYVDRILKGSRPGVLPIERPDKFELVINLKTAKALGVTIPTPLLLRANHVLE